MPVTRATSAAGTYATTSALAPATPPRADRSLVAARLLVAGALVAWGIQHLLLGDFVSRVFPVPAAGFPLRSILARLAGLLLVATGAAIVAAAPAHPADDPRRGAALPRIARLAAHLVAGLAVALVWAVRLPPLVATPRAGLAWTLLGKGIAIAGTLLLVAATFGPTRLRAVGRAMLAAFLVLGGVQHFIYPAFVATLVPAWLPARAAWVHLAGAALVAGGLGLLVPSARRLAARCTSAMILAWVPLVHLPRALANPGDANETTALFEAIAFAAGAWLARDEGIGARC